MRDDSGKGSRIWRLIVILNFLVLALFPGPGPVSGREWEEKQEVSRTVESLFNAWSTGRNEVPRDYFLPGATWIVASQAISGVLRGEFLVFVNKLESFAESSKEPASFGRRLSDIEVELVDANHLALVNSKYEDIRGGEALRHGVAFLTLVRQGDAWKVVTMGFTQLRGPASAASPIHSSVDFPLFVFLS